VLWAIMAHPEKPSRDIPIAIIDEAVVFSDEAFPIGAIPIGNFVPRHHGLFMMGGVKVVVEKQQPKKRCIFDNRRALKNAISSAMFRE
jgi:hypothetical protein